MPTMQDIADRVGVHRATVSNVLNGKLSATRSDAAKRAMEIRRVAAEIGYRPSAAARATRTGRTHCLGMLLSARQARSVHVPEFNMGLMNAAHARNLCVMKDSIDDALSEEALPPRLLRENMVDGLLVNYAFGTPVAVQRVLDRCQIPTIWINRKREANCVRPNDYGAALEATRYLLAHGHRRVLYLDGALSELPPDVDAHYSAEDRRQGYIAAMKEAGLTPECTTASSDSISPADGAGDMFSRFIYLLGQPEVPSAVLCANDSGRVLLAAAWKLGLRVPEDLSVITFDNAADANRQIAMDRVLIRYEAMGHAAVEQLCALIDQPTQPRKPVVIPVEFHRCGTVAAAPVVT